METLLSLTSKRAGEWFKEELRQLGGVDHLVRTVTSSVQSLIACGPPASSADPLCANRRAMETFSKVERCLKVLENVSKRVLVIETHIYFMFYKFIGYSIYK